MIAWGPLARGLGWVLGLVPSTHKGELAHCGLTVLGRTARLMVCRPPMAAPNLERGIGPAAMKFAVGRSGFGGGWGLVGWVWLVLVVPARWRLLCLGSSGWFGVVGRSVGPVAGGGRARLDSVPPPLLGFFRFSDSIFDRWSLPLALLRRSPHV